MSDDFFAELEAEISQATAKSKLRVDAKELRKRALNSRLEKGIRDKAMEEWKAVQAIIDAETWIVAKSAALFTEQHCDGCGSLHYTFLQFMQEEHKIRDPRTRRWVRVSLPPENLVRETIVQPLTTHICSDCCEDHGFDAKFPSVRLEPREGGLTVSANYEQGDINGSSS